MKISYLVTCSNETNTLDRLLYGILTVMNSEDEVIILQDNCDDGVNEYGKTTSDIIKRYINCPGFPIGVYWFKHSLDNDYGSHKNYGNSKCTGDWIFQIDGDELPPESLLGDNLRDIIESNPSVELIYVPRTNDFKGVTQEHANHWGWRLSQSPSYTRPIVNWPDYQGRIYRNIPDKIKWDRRLHEKIIGHNEYSFLPEDEAYALYHDKTIEKQLETNKRYNTVFTQEENQGHKVK